MGLEEQFNEAAEAIKTMKKSPSDQDLLEIYGLYKQSTVGDVNTDRPGMLDLKGKAKWDAWSSLKGTSKDQAKEKYIAKATALRQDS